MGTRGFLGFAADDTEKIAYNHFDSYPSGLGVEVLGWLRDVVAGAQPVPGDVPLIEAVRALRVVTDDEPPTEADLERLARYGDPHVGGPMDNEVVQSWYQLLRQAQGSPADTLAAGVIEDASHFPLDSLFCEWGYLIDLVDGKPANGRLEVYRGFQEQAHTEGRFATRGDGPQRVRPGSDGYYPVRLLASWPLTELPDDATFLAATEGKAYADEESTAEST